MTNFRWHQRKICPSLLFSNFFTNILTDNDDDDDGGGVGGGGGA